MDKLPVTVERILGYIRRSRQDVVRERKTNQDTLAEQRELLTSILGGMTTPYEIREEIGSGDNIEGRPVFKGILDELRLIKPRTVAIAVKEISRLGRGDMEQMGAIYNVIREKQIFIITPFKIYDPLNDEDDMAIQFYMFVSRVELQMTKRRLRESRYTYASQGRWMTGGGGIPFAYTFNPFTQKLEKDEKTAWVVEKIYHHYVNDRLGYNAISTVMRNEGIPAPKGKPYFHPIVIRRILTNPCYKGDLHFKTTQKINKSIIKRPLEDWIIVENAHPAIVSKELWKEAQEILTENRAKPTVRLDFEPNPLASLIKCGSCGKKMIRQSSTQYYTKKDGMVSKYFKEFLNCLECRVYVKYQSVEQEIVRILQQNFIAIDAVELGKKLKTLIDVEALRNRQIDPHERIQKLKKEMEGLQKEMQQVIRLLTKEIISEEQFDLTKKDIEQSLKEKEKQLDLLWGQAEKEHTGEINLEKLQSGLKSLLYVYLHSELSKGEKNELLRGIFDYIMLDFVAKGKFNLTMVFNPKILLNTSAIG